MKFQVSGLDAEIEVFTTRPDTLFGATYMVPSPEHPLVAKIAAPGERANLEAYSEKSVRSRIWNEPIWPRKRPAPSPGHLRSIRSTVKEFPSGLRTTF